MYNTSAQSAEATRLLSAAQDLNASFGRDIGVTASKMAYLKSGAREDSEYNDII